MGLGQAQGPLTPGQVSVPASETSTRLQGLQPLTEYQVTVVALYANSIGEAVSGTARTSEPFCYSYPPTSSLPLPPCHPHFSPLTNPWWDLPPHSRPGGAGANSAECHRPQPPGGLAGRAGGHRLPCDLAAPER